MIGSKREREEGKEDILLLLPSFCAFLLFFLLHLPPPLPS